MAYFLLTRITDYFLQQNRPECGKFSISTMILFAIVMAIIISYIKTVLLIPVLIFLYSRDLREIFPFKHISAFNLFITQGQLLEYVLE